MADENDLGVTLVGFVPGQQVGAGRFTLKSLLGQGGMGVVWLAHDQRLGEDVALKFLPPQVRLDPAAIDDLRRETAKSRKLTHPNIIRIHDLYEATGTDAFISMEYIDGPTLSAQRVAQETKVLTWEYLAPLTLQLCQALDYAHGEKVIHRDLKPTNLMIDGRARLKLADFGIARVVSDSMSRVSMRQGTSGTLVYMSPQQLDGKTPRVTDDIYAVGATLYELLTGKPPFYSGDVMHQVRNIVPDPIEQRLADFEIENPVPVDVSRTILACLAKDPLQRPQSAGDVAEQLGLGGFPSTKSARTTDPATSTTPPDRPISVSTAPAAPPPKKKSLLPLLAGIVLLLAATGGLGYYFGVVAPANQARLAEIARQEAIEKQKEAEAEQAADAAQKAQLEAQAKAAADEAERLKTEAEKAKALADQQAAEAAAAAAAKKAADDAAAKQKAEMAQMPPEAQDSYNKAKLALQQGDTQLAIRYFLEARKLAPNSTTLLNQLGQAEATIPGRELRAITWFAAYLTASPNAPDADSIRSQISSLDIKSQGNLAKLIQSAQDSISQIPKPANTQDTYFDGYYNTAATLWAASGDYDTAQKTVDLIQDSGDKISALVSIAQAQQDLGDFSTALSTLDSALSSRYSISDQWSQSWSVWQIADAQVSVAGRQVDAGDPAGAKDTAAKVLNTISSIASPDFNTRCNNLANTLANLATIQVKAGDVAGAKSNIATALQDIQSDKNSTPSLTGNDKATSLTNIANAQIAAGDLSGASDSLASAQSACDMIDDPQLEYCKQSDLSNIRQSFMTIATAEPTEGHFSDALDLIKKGYALLHQVKSTQYDYSGMAGSVRTIADAEMAAGDFDGIKSTADLIEENEPTKAGIYSDLGTLEISIADSQQLIGDFPGALVTLNRAHDLAGQLPDDNSYGGRDYLLQNITSEASLIAENQIQAKDFPGALATAALAKTFATEIHQKTYHDQALGRIINIQANAGDFAGAQKSIDLVSDNDYKQSDESEIAYSQAKAGDWAGAQKTIGLLQDPQSRNSAEWYISYYLLKEKGNPDNLGILAAALKTADLIQDPVSKALFEGGIGAQQVTAGDKTTGLATLAAAQQLATTIKDPLSQAYAESSIGQYQGLGQFGAGDSAAALVTLAVGAKAAENIQDPKTKATWETTISSNQSLNGDKTAARATALEAQKALGMISSAKDKDQMTRTVVRDLASAGDVDDALKLPDTIADKDIQLWATEDIAEAQFKSGDKDGAGKTLALITDADKRDSEWASIVGQQAQAGNYADAQATIDLIQSQEQKDRAEGNIASYQAQAGKLDDAQKTAAMIQDSGALDDAAEAISRDLAGNKKDVAGAQKWADEIKGTLDRDYAEDTIITAQLAAGDIAGAQKTFSKLETYYLPDAGKAIGQAQIKAGDIPGAEKTASLMSMNDRQTLVTLLTTNEAESQAKAAGAGDASHPIDLIGGSLWKNAHAKVISDLATFPPPPTPPSNSNSSSPNTVENWTYLNEANNYELNQPIFLDFDSFIKSLPTDDPAKHFYALNNAANSYISMQNQVDKYLKLLPKPASN